MEPNFINNILPDRMCNLTAETLIKWSCDQLLDKLSNKLVSIFEYQKAVLSVFSFMFRSS